MLQARIPATGGPTVGQRPVRYGTGNSDELTEDEIELYNGD